MIIESINFLGGRGGGGEGRVKRGCLGLFIPYHLPPKVEEGVTTSFSRVCRGRGALRESRVVARPCLFISCFSFFLSSFFLSPPVHLRTHWGSVGYIHWISFSSIKQMIDLPHSPISLPLFRFSALNVGVLGLAVSFFVWKCGI